MKEIDVSRLRRDYSKEPLHKGVNQCDRAEIPSREDLEYLYIELNMKLIDIAKYFGYTNQGIPYKWTKLYGIKKNKEAIEANKRRTWLERYGVDNPMKSLVVKEKGYQTYLAKTNGEYRCSGENPKTHEKGMLAYKARSGYLTSFQNPEIHTIAIEKSKSEDSKVQRAQTYFERTGYMHPSQNPEVVGKISEANKLHREELANREKLLSFIKLQELKTIKGLSDKLGIGETTLNRYINEYGLQQVVNYSISNLEFEIKQCLPMTFKKDRTVLKPLEIDLYDMNSKIGIEVNGNYFHGDLEKKDKYYHQSKSLDALNKGSFIYHIFEYEWDDEHKRKIIISQLDNLLGRNSNKIYARKCKIVEVKPKDKNKFINENHLQPNDNSKVALGLEYEGELVSVMTFATNWVYGAEWELRRFCSKVGMNVVGGASKLFGYFVKQYKPKSIISYSDISKTKGGMYSMLGFKEIGITRPDYVWCDSQQYILKRNCRKSKLQKQGIDIKDKTESQIMREEGFYKIYDCGMKRWMWKSQGENNGGK